MSREHQIVGRKGGAALRQFLAQEGVALAPMMELLEAGQLAVEGLGKAALEAVFLPATGRLQVTREDIDAPNRRLLGSSGPGGVTDAGSLPG